MKRIAALLLSAMLLMTAGLAAAEDAVHTQITAEADREGLSAYLAQLGLAEDEAERMAGIAADLCLAVSLDMYAADGESLAMLSLSGKPLIDADVRTRDGAVLASSLLPDTLLAFPEVPSSALAELFLRRIDFLSLLKILMACGEDMGTWEQGLRYEETEGAYAGDAYTGGTACRTARFDDRDMAALLSAWLRTLENAVEENREQNADLYEQACLELRELRAWVSDMAMRNGMRYIRREVTDAANNKVGVSLTALRGDDQLATVSAGYRDDELQRFVIGFGVNEQVYFLDGRTLTPDSAAFRLYTDPARMGFAAASASEENLLGTLTVSSLNMHTDNEGTTITCDLGLEIPGRPALAEKVTLIAKDDLTSMKSEARLAGSDTPLLTLSLTQDRQPMPAYAWPEDAKVLTPDQTDELAAALAQGIIGTALPMLTALPPSLLQLLLAP